MPRDLVNSKPASSKTVKYSIARTLATSVIGKQE